MPTFWRVEVGGLFFHQSLLLPFVCQTQVVAFFKCVLYE